MRPASLGPPVNPLLDAIGQRTFVVSTQPEIANLVKLSGNFLIASVIESLGEAMALVGLGITSLSMQASSIGPVKMMIRNVDTRSLKPAVEKLAGASGRTARS